MNHLLVFAIVCTLLCISGCRKSIPPPPKSVTVHKATVTLKGSADSKDTIYISSNDDWQVTLEQGVDWIKVEPMNGSGDGMIVIATISKNSTFTRRTTNIDVRTVNGTESRSITVVQVQLNEIILNAVFGGENYDAFTDFTSTPGGGYIAVGYSTSTQGDGTGSKGGQDVWIVRFDSEGKKVWHKKFGGTQDDAANSIVRAAAGHYIILGSTLSNDGDVTNNKGEKDAWLLDIDQDGNLLWQKTLGGSKDEQLFNIKPSDDGGYLLAGWTMSNDGDVASNHGNSDAWIVKIDEQGNILSEKTYGGSNDDLAFDATSVSDGGYIFTGTVKSIDGDASDRTEEIFSAWLVKLNPAGAMAGKIYLGESEFDYGAVALEAANGDYLFAGETNTSGVFDHFHGERDAFVCRLDAGGNIRWKKAFGGALRDGPSDLIETTDGNFIFAGITLSTDGDILHSNGGEDGWLLKLNSEGDIINNTATGGSLNDNMMRIKQLNNNNFAFVGSTGSYEDAYPDLAEVIHGWFQVVTFQ